MKHCGPCSLQGTLQNKGQSSLVVRKKCEIKFLVAYIADICLYQVLNETQ